MKVLKTCNLSQKSVFSLKSLLKNTTRFFSLTNKPTDFDFEDNFDIDKFIQAELDKSKPLQNGKNTLAGDYLKNVQDFNAVGATENESMPKKSVEKINVNSTDKRPVDFMIDNNFLDQTNVFDINNFIEQDVSETIPKKGFLGGFTPEFQNLSADNNFDQKKPFDHNYGSVDNF